LVVLLLLALAVRLWLMPGIYVSDDLYYRIHAHDLLRGDFVPEGHFRARVGFIVPLAISEALFGVNDLAGVLFPMACGLLQVAAVYWIGCMLATRTAGLIAGLVAAMVPNSIFWGGLAWTDVPASAFMAVGAAFFIRACLAPEDRWAPAAAGLALGMAYLQRESSILLWFFFAVGVLMRRISLKRCAAVAGGFAAVVAAEMLYFTIARGDPLGRFHAATGASYSPEVLDFYIPDLAHRLTTKIPSMMFSPFDGEFPYFGGIFLLFAAACAVWLVRFDRGWRLPLVWWWTLFAAILFFPARLNPYRPAVVGQPKDLEPLVAGAAVVVGLFIASMRGRWRWVGRGAVVLTCAVGLLAAWKLKQDSTLRWVGPKQAYDYLVQQRASPIYTDPRTADLFRYWDKFREPPFAHAFETMQKPPAAIWVVYDEHWIDFLRRQYDYGEPGWLFRGILADHTYVRMCFHSPARRSWRHPFQDVGAGSITRVYYFPSR
jgi:hypothetical protein